MIPGRVLHTLGLAALMSCAAPTEPHAAAAPQAREPWPSFGSLPTGPDNAITDVAGVAVGHVTVVRGDAIRTGATAIVPHPGNVFADKVPAAVVVGNGFGKLVGSTQVEELGQLETPILLTNTLQVWDAAAAIVDEVLRHPDNAEVRSVNPVVGETNDGWLSDIRARALTRDDFLLALHSAKPGPVEQGAVGAGTGTRALGYKGGIGTASRQVDGFTVGVLVQSNFGGTLTVDGVEVGPPSASTADHDGSCMIVVATDAPLDARRLRRLAARALTGMARTGASMSHGSGDYVIAFSVAESVRIGRDAPAALVPDERLSPLFVAVADATEEAIVSSLLAAKTTSGRSGHTAPGLTRDDLRRARERAR